MSPDPMIDSAAKPRALLALFCGAIAIGFAPIGVRLASVSPEASAFWRLLIAALVLNLVRLRLPAPRPARVPWRAVWVAGIAFAGDLAVWHNAIHYTSVANATLLANLAPVFVTLYAAVILRHRIAPRFVIGLAVAFAGAAVLVGASVPVGGVQVRGDLLGVVTAMFYTAYLLGIAGARRELDTLTVMAYTSVIAAVCVAPVALASARFWPVGIDWLWLAMLALISHIGGQGMIAFALAHLPTTFSSVSLLVQPVAAALMAWLLFAEALGPWQWLGAAVVLVGINWCRGAADLVASRAPDAPRVGPG